MKKIWLTALASVMLTGSILAQGKYLANPEDYKIRIPAVVRKNIAEEMEISLELKHRAI